MKAGVFHGIKDVRLEEIKIPQIKHEEVPLTQWEEGFRRAKERSPVRVLLYSEKK